MLYIHIIHDIIRICTLCVCVYLCVCVRACVFIQRAAVDMEEVEDDGEQRKVSLPL